MTTATVEAPTLSKTTEERVRDNAADMLRTAFAWIDLHDAWGRVLSVSPLCDSIHLQTAFFRRVFAGRTVTVEERDWGTVYKVSDSGLSFVASERNLPRQPATSEITL